MIVFLHGVPETAAIWKKTRQAVEQKSIALSLPGFGCPRPPGFVATKDEYVRWILGELDRISGPIDLVGHDWGAGFTYRIATAYGERLHSWVADLGNGVHPDYQWHEFAKIWQTPGEGEAFFASQNALPPEQLAPRYEAMGVPLADALEMAAGADATMGDCILDLYRSATPNLYALWGPFNPTKAPGLILHATDDPFSDKRLAAESASALGARFELIRDVGHFWPYEAPDKGAAILKSFWASLT
ncbi:MAG: alpha/beta hydrolase [Methylocella sp.]